MSQYKVYKIILELGGKASTGEIRELARKKFPDATLFMYVNNRLNKLEKKGIVKRIITNSTSYWEIIDDYI